MLNEEILLRKRLENWTRTNQRAVMEEFVDLLSIPNVSADRPNIREECHRSEVNANAARVSD